MKKLIMLSMLLFAGVSFGQFGPVTLNGATGMWNPNGSNVVVSGNYYFNSTILLTNSVLRDINGAGIDIAGSGVTVYIYTGTVTGGSHVSTGTVYGVSNFWAYVTIPSPNTQLGGTQPAYVQISPSNSVVGKVVYSGNLVVTCSNPLQ